MVRIRVEPEQLLNTAQQIADGSGRLRGIVGGLGGALGGLNTSEDGGQFQAAVAMRVGAAQNAASGPANRLGDLGIDLNNRGNRFLSADLAANGAVLGISITSDNWKAKNRDIGFWARLRNLPVDLLNILLKSLNLSGKAVPLYAPVAALIPPIGLLLWRGKVFDGLKLPAWWPRSKGVAIDISRLGNVKEPPLSKIRITLPPNPNTANMAQRVPGNGDAGRYWRLGNKENGFPKSDCTWYAAMAVKEASRGKVDLNAVPNQKENVEINRLYTEKVALDSKVKGRPLTKQESGSLWTEVEGKYLVSIGKPPTTLGNAGEWHATAEQWAEQYPDGPIKSVDHMPHEKGDVLNQGGHVAFVEKADQVKNAKGIVNWEIQVSEESATGEGFADGKQVKLNDGSGALRWERTITLPVDTDGTVKNKDVWFIHPNYPPETGYLESPDLRPGPQANPSAQLKT